MSLRLREHIPYVSLNNLFNQDRWHALIYYVYTGTINFAPLRSQGVAYRTQQIIEHHEKNPDHPVLCSPKSMYRLADIVSSATVNEVSNIYD